MQLVLSPWICWALPENVYFPSYMVPPHVSSGQFFYCCCCWNMSVMVLLKDLCIRKERWPCVLCHAWHECTFFCLNYCAIYAGSKVNQLFLCDEWTLTCKRYGWSLTLHRWINFLAGWSVLIGLPTPLSIVCIRVAELPQVSENDQRRKKSATFCMISWRALQSPMECRKMYTLNSAWLVNHTFFASL